MSYSEDWARTLGVDPEKLSTHKQELLVIW